LSGPGGWGRSSSPLQALLKRFLVRGALVLAPLLILSVFLLSRAGSWLVVEDPLEKADAIFVLGGTRFERPLEAVDLYKEGWAPRILLFREVKDFGEVALLERGFPFQLESDVQADALRRMVPAAAVIVLGEQDSTRGEAAAIRDQALKHGWTRIIVVSSKQHTRRARMVITRRLANSNVKTIMRASRYDRTDTEYWWRNRASLRFTLFETQRLFGYWTGIAD
jgi:uncharacterized SAM-binding protein YcdF (DUF218 family)